MFNADNVDFGDVFHCRVDFNNGWKGTLNSILFVLQLDLNVFSSFSVKWLE